MHLVAFISNLNLPQIPCGLDLSELRRGENTTECKSLTGELPSAFVESEKF